MFDAACLTNNGAYFLAHFGLLDRILKLLLIYWARSVF